MPAVRMMYSGPTTDSICTMNDEHLYELARELGEMLMAASQRVAVAESCTGGWVGKVLTGIPGSSRWFECGFATYTNVAKMRMLGVPEAAFNPGGAVSAPVVEAMAAGAVEQSDAAWSLGISGIAGPDGGSRDKPVGTVWIGWAGPGRDPDSRCFLFEGDRDAVRQASVQAALEGLLERMRRSGDAD